MEKSELSFGLNPIDVLEDLFGDGIAFIKQYDFSRANYDIAHRLHAVTSVASICYNNPKAVGSESLFRRLSAESAGLPSSSFEFIPILVNELEYSLKLKELKLDKDAMHMTKYSNVVKSEEGLTYRLTNYRAVVYDFEETNGALDYVNYYNQDDYELKIIKENFDVFLLKIDMPTRSQIVRHRTPNYQELSRRYVSGKKLDFEFYIAEDMKDVHSSYYTSCHAEEEDLDITAVINICLEFYKAALAKGVKAQVARGIIPQCAYTNLWMAMNKEAMEAFLKLRTKPEAQWEIRQIANHMSEVTSIIYDASILENTITVH